jgi:hypothetical protein
MAFKKIDTTTEKSADGVLFDVNNGDLKAILDIKDKWGFKTETDVLRYALAVIRQAENKVVYIDRDGSKVGLTPSEDLIAEK